MKTRSAMKTWMTVLALSAAGTMLATSAFAQSSGSDTTKSGATGTDMKSGAMGSDTKSGAKGGDMKSDAMKSGPGRSARGAGSPEQVKAVQQALKDKGHDAGAIDGKMGPKTQGALRDFQQKEGLKATGRADAETMAKLGVEARTSAVGGSSTSPAASPSGVSSSGRSSSTGAPSGAQPGAGSSAADAGASKDATSTGAKQAK